MKNIYAFFASIDEYPVAHHRLNGCVNDMRAMKELLEQRVDPEKTKLHIRVLENEEATRDNIIKGFTEHLAQAQQGDLAFFYFSGHGSQEPAHEAFWPFEEDKMNQSIVCYDSRLEGGTDLVDKELGYLISVVAEKSPEMVAVMDCCHSGSGTRSAGEETKTRQMENSATMRALESYLGYERYKFENGKLTQIPNGRHVLLAAAHAKETAKENRFEGKPRGVFTYSLIDTLKRARTPLSYQLLRERTQTKVFNLAEAQTPQLDVLDPEDVNKLFMEGTMSESTDYHAVTWSEDYGSWVIPIGGLQGIPVPRPGDKKPTTFFLFSENTTEAGLKDTSKAIGIATVTKVEPALAEVSLPEDISSNHEVSYMATLKQLSKTPLRLWVEGDEEGVKRLKKALSGEKGPAPGYVALADSLDEANYRVISKSGEYLITRPQDGRPLVMKAKGFNTLKTVNDLEHISRWVKVSETNNPDTAFATFPFKVEILEVTPQDKEGKPVDKLDFAATYMPNEDKPSRKWKPRTFKVKLTNTSEEPLYAGILYLSGRYAIEPLPMAMFISEDLHGKKTKRADFIRKIQPGESIEAISGRPLTAGLGEAYSNAGITEAIDILKVFASTDQFDITKFDKQKALELPVPNARTQPNSYGDELDDLLGGDWTTKDIAIRTVQPLAPVPFGWNKGLGLFGFKMAPHSQISGEATLTTETIAKDGLGKSVYPPVLPNGIEIEAVRFTQGWKSDLGLAVLELFKVNSPESVNQGAPIELDLGENVRDPEQIIAIGVEGDKYSVVGRYDNGKLFITQLPKETPTMNQGLPDSRKISFVRAIGDVEAAVEAIQNQSL